VSGVVDRDLGYADLLDFLRGVDDAAPGIYVGVRSGQGAEQVEGGDLTLAGLAAVHEFGSPAQGIPERSFLRSTVDAGALDYSGELVDALSRGLDGKGDLRAAAAKLGARMAGDVQQRIADRIAPDLKPATVAAKVAGRDVPLVDTGRLRQAIDSEVRFEK